MNEVYLKNNFLTKKDFKASFNKIMNEMSSLKKAVLRVEDRISSYSDMYEINKWHAEKLANRISH